MPPALERWNLNHWTTREVWGRCSEKTGPVAGLKPHSEGLGMQSGRGSEGVGRASRGAWG